MKSSVSMVVAAVCGLGAVAVIAFGSQPAQAQEVIAPPPPEFIATTEPAYYEGRPAYWYGGRWCYRDGAGWGAYGAEPGYLREWRSRPEFGARYHYQGGGFRGGGSHGGEVHGGGNRGGGRGGGHR